MTTHEEAAAQLGLRSNAYDYNSHVRLVAALREAGKVLELDAARRAFCSRLPMTEGNNEFAANILPEAQHHNAPLVCRRLASVA